MGRVYNWADSHINGLLPGGFSPAEVQKTQYAALDSLVGGFLPGGARTYSYPVASSGYNSPTPSGSPLDKAKGLLDDLKVAGIGAGVAVVAIAGVVAFVMLRD